MPFCIRLASALQPHMHAHVRTLKRQTSECFLRLVMSTTVAAAFQGRRLGRIPARLLRRSMRDGDAQPANLARKAASVAQAAANVTGLEVNVMHRSSECDESTQ